MTKDDEITRLINQNLIFALWGVLSVIRTLPVERGFISGVEYVPLRGNGGVDVESLINEVVEGLNK